MNDKKIKITCKGQKYISIEKLKNFQGNLKTLSNENFKKLKRLILKYGFSFPVFVWNDSILDGHQRIFVVLELLKEGYSIGKIPCVEVEAADEKEAAEKLLAVNSQYAKMTEDGLIGFIQEKDISDKAFGDLDFPDVDFYRIMNDIGFNRLMAENVSEDNPKLKKFVEAREKSREQFKDKSELNYWICLIFQSYKQKMEFLSLVPDLQVKYGMYVDGEMFAKATGIKISSNKQKAFKSNLNIGLKEKVMKL